MAECNYGVPFPVDFDKMFGTWVDYKEYKKVGIKGAKAKALEEYNNIAVGKGPVSKKQKAG